MSEPRTEAGKRLPSFDLFCEHPWDEHFVLVCPGSIVCGGYLPHDCATPGCMEPEWGVHGQDCRGWNIGCPYTSTPSSEAVTAERARLAEAVEVIPRIAYLDPDGEWVTDKRAVPVAAVLALLRDTP